MRDSIVNAPSSPQGYLWITPPSRSSRFNCFFISNLLSYHLVTPPDRLRATRISDFVFRAMVANRNVAKFITARGTLCLGSFVFTLHASMTIARQRAKSLEEEESAFNAAQPPASGELKNPVAASQTLSGRAARAELHSCQTPLAAGHPPGARILPYLSSAAASHTSSNTFVLLEARRAGCEDSPHASSQCTNAFTALVTPPPCSYRAALLTKANPPPHARTRFTPITSTHGCFRCLALDHQVRDCRDPTWSRNCGANGHRSYRCTMPLDREQTPYHPTRPTLPTTDGPVTITPVSFVALRNATSSLLPRTPPPWPTHAHSPRTTPTSPTHATAPPPPPPDLLLTAAYDPTNMHASSIFPATLEAPPADVGILGAALPPSRSEVGILGARPPPPLRLHSPPPPVPRASPEFKDIDEVGYMAFACQAPVSPPSETTSEGRSPPRAASLPVQPPMASPEDGSKAETVYSDGSGDPAPVPAVPQPDWREIWILARWDEENLRYAYVFILPVVANPTFFIREGFETELGPLQFELLPSSRWAMLARFHTEGEREAAAQFGLFLHEGYHLELERSELTSNRFTRVPLFLGYLSMQDFPIEHWFKENIKASLACIGTVLEVDSTCLTVFDFSSLHVVVELEDDNEEDMPRNVWIRTPGGSGCITGVFVAHIWPRAAQFDVQGNYVPYFAPPPPPALVLPQQQPHQAPLAPPQQPHALAPAAPTAAPLQSHTYHYLDLIDAIHTYPLSRLPAFPMTITLPRRIASSPAPLPLTWRSNVVPLLLT